ncbi:hypothetical protein B7494_g4185 [Chlorociboria aeruginascens]|nr:hypothetical protein B7494_g4185 [Chlorociboria aeruginascens]
MATNPPPNPLPNVEVTETSTQSSTSSASTRKCPNCQSTFPDMSSPEFDDHMATCTRPSTANFEDDSDSSLSSPPLSPPVSPQRSAEDLIIVDSQENVEDDEEEVFTYDTAAKLEPEHGDEVDFLSPTKGTVPASARPSSSGSSALPNFNRSFANPVVDSDIRPYLNPGSIFDYYDAVDGNELIDGNDLVDDTKSVNDVEVAADPGPTPPPLPAGEQSVNGDGIEIASDALSEADERAPKPKGKPFKYPKLTPIGTFVEYIKNPDDLTYEELYHRTDIVSGVLCGLQAEFDRVTRAITAHELGRKGEAEIAEQEAQDRADQRQTAKNQRLFQFQEEYAGELALEGEEFEARLQDLRQRKGPKVSVNVFETLRDLKDPQFMAAWQKELDRDQPKRHLTNVPIKEPKPNKEEVETEKRQRAKLLDPIKFNDVKMADVYGFEHSTHPKHVGQQPLPELERASTRSAETGTQGTRTRVARKQTRKVYEASHTPEAEPERPATKRVRRQPTLTSATQSSGQSQAGPSRTVTPPPVRVFASGKRVGRPPTKSKLNAVHRAPSLEAELQSAAESLVNKTRADKAVANPGLSSAATDQNELLPSTEQDDASQVASANASRPTTSYSNATTSTAATRRSNRAATREKTQARELRAQEPPKAIGKRKRGTKVEEPVSLPAPIGADDVVNPRKKQKTVGVGPAVSQPAVPDKKGKARAVSEVAPVPDVQEDSDADIIKPSRKRKGSTVNSSAAQASVPAKKRKANNGKSQSVSVPDVEGSAGEAPKASRKRKASVKDSSAPESSVSAKKRKTNGGSQLAPVIDEEEEDDDEDLTPAEKEEKRLAVEAKEAQDKKKRLLSESMKNRWASGGMAAAQATRRRNAANKKAEKLQAVADSDAVADNTNDAPAGPSQPASAQPLQPASRASSVAPTKSTKSARSKTAATAKATNTKAAVPKTAPKAKKAKATTTPAPSVPTPAAVIPAPAATNGERRSGRIRKPTRAGLGLDGADDYEEEEEPRSQLLSEYEHYQQISDPNSPILGKRARRPLNLSFTDDDASGDDASGDDYYYL